MFIWHQYMLLFFLLVWDQAAEGPPCSARFGSGCGERGCAAGPTCAEQTEQQQVQGGCHWRLRWWSHRDHHRVECCLCAAMHGTIVAIHGVTEPTAFPLPLNLLISLENAFSHFCKEAASAPKWQKLLHFWADFDQGQWNNSGWKWQWYTFPVSSRLYPSNAKAAAAKSELAKQ